MVTPTAVVNWIMDTNHFDNGAFWLLSSLPTSVEVLGVIGFSMTALGYLFVLLRVVLCSATPIRSRVHPSKKRIMSTFTEASTRIVSFSHGLSASTHPRDVALRRLIDLAVGLSSADRPSRKAVVGFLNLSPMV